MFTFTFTFTSRHHFALLENGSRKMNIVEILDVEIFRFFNKKSIVFHLKKHFFFLPHLFPVKSPVPPMINPTCVFEKSRPAYVKPHMRI